MEGVPNENIREFKHMTDSFSANMIKMRLLSKEILKETTKIWPERTIEEMFSYIWSLDEAQKALTPVILPVIGKKDSLSSFHLQKGDSAYQINDLDTALKCYNWAIVTAPHPDILADNVEAHDTEMYKCLARGYESRSAVLFALKQYEKCSRDIDRSLELDSSKISCKMIEMKARCLKLISEGKDKPFEVTAESLKSSHLSFAYTNPEPPKLSEVNPTMPSLSSSVKVAYTPSQGRHLIADKDINPGEIVSIDDGYCNIVYSEMVKLHCTVCMKRSMAPLPCPICDTVVFCSEECRKEGLSGCHWQECPILPTLYLPDMGRRHALAYRVMTKTSYAKLKELIPLLRLEAEEKSPMNLGFNNEGIYDVEHYRTVYHLKTNIEKHSSEAVVERCLEAFIITKLLHLSGRYFLTSDGEPFTPSHEDFVLTGSTLVHHMMNLMSTVRDITFFKVQVGVQQPSHQRACGNGIYSASCLMSHTCNANCSPFFYGKTEIVRAMHFIPAGKPLTMQHVAHVHCSCETCKISQEHPTKFPRILILRCINCDDGISPVTKVCPKCHLNYGEAEGAAVAEEEGAAVAEEEGAAVAEAEGAAVAEEEGAAVAEAEGATVAEAEGATVAPYNYMEIKRKIEKVQLQYVVVMQFCYTNISCSDKELKVVRLLIKLLCKYVKQPCHLLINATNTLRFLCDKRGSCVYFKHDLDSPCPVS